MVNIPLEAIESAVIIRARRPLPGPHGKPIRQGTLAYLVGIGQIYVPDQDHPEKADLYYVEPGTRHYDWEEVRIGGSLSEVRMFDREPIVIVDDAA